MWQSIAKSVFGSANDRYVKSLDKTVARINALEEQLVDFSDEELAVARLAMQRLRWSPGERRTRRWSSSPGPRVDLRAAIGRSLRTRGTG